MQIQLKVALIANNSVLVQVMTWRRKGDKPLSEPMLTHVIEAYMGRVTRP